MLNLYFLTLLGIEDMVATTSNTSIDLTTSRLYTVSTVHPTMPMRATSKNAPNANLRKGSLSSNMVFPRKTELTRKKPTEQAKPSKETWTKHRFRKINAIMRYEKRLQENLELRVIDCSSLSRLNL